jgi:NAD+ kinase
MKIGIYGRPSMGAHQAYLTMLFDLLNQKEIEFCISKSICKILSIPSTAEVFENCEELKSHQVDILLCLGGDGSMLDTLTFVKDSGIPVLGINLGRLGFLASINKDDTEKTLASLQRGAYQIDKRMLLQLTSNNALFDGENFALNEMTIQRSNSSSMIIVSAFMNGELLNQYFTDGLIISTPTGSTGYNLSCGGPIIHPSSKNFIITPISPHNLNVRPIVLPEDVILSFDVKGRTPNFLCTLDAKSSMITSEFQLGVKKADFTMNLVRLHDNSFLDALKDKLMWGLDQRG